MYNSVIKEARIFRKRSNCYAGKQNTKADSKTQRKWVVLCGSRRNDSEAREKAGRTGRACDGCTNDAGAFGDDESAMALLHKMDHGTEQFLERAEADVIAFFEKHQLHYVRRAPEQAIVIYELPFRTKNINYLVRVILEAEAKACRIDAVYPFSAEKIYEYPLCRAIAKENFRYRYGALQYDERDGEISFRYSYSISHGVYEDELGRSFECVLRSAENSYAVVQKNCVGKYKRNEAKEMLNEFHALVDDLNEMND